MSEYDQGSAYENYDSNDQLSPYELLMQMQSWNKSIFLRIEDAEKEWRTQLSIVNGEIRQEVEDVQEELSTSLSTTAAGIRAEMVDNKNSLTNQITATAEGIRASMVDADNKLSNQITTTAAGINASISDTNRNLSTHITATAAGLASKVESKDFTGQKMASLITQSSTAISLIATSLNLSGYVTFNSLGRYGTTEIDGSRITTGYISAERLDAQAIKAKLISAGGISADYIQAGDLVGMSITGSTFYQTSGWANVSIASGMVSTYDGFIGSTATMNGKFDASGSGGSISAAPGALNISGNYGSLRLMPSELWVSGGGMAFRGSFDFSQATVYGLPVADSVTYATYAGYMRDTYGTMYSPSAFAQTRTSGLRFGYSTASSLLYVDMNGVSQGSVKIT